VASLYSDKRKALESLISQLIPGFSIESKKESTLCRFYSKILFFNKSFMTEYVTTLYPKIFVPELPWREDDDLEATVILAHEFVHLYDRKRMWLWFNLLYLSPQVLALFAVATFWSPINILWLVCLAPMPSLGRAWLEYRGYRATLASVYWLTGKKVELDWLLLQFSGPAYYWMFPFKNILSKKFEKDFIRIENGDILGEELELMKTVLDAS